MKLELEYRFIFYCTVFRKLRKFNKLFSANSENSLPALPTCPKISVFCLKQGR